jgi:dTDP-4-dehydrorhamnose 3,5-epimerase-like enzyme
MVKGYKIIEIPSIVDNRGGLSFVEYGQILEFVVKRVYWLYDLKQTRGSHAHKELKQFIFCPHGSIEITLDDGTERESIFLDSPSKGICITQPLWRDITNFKNDPQVIVLASEVYEESDYIRSYEEFKQWMSNS